MAMNDQRVNKRIQEELKTINVMIRLYCRKHHNDSLCPVCHKLLEYATARLTRCPQKEDKPTCAKCTIHCYRPEMREAVRQVMRYSGPRMMIYHPLMAFRHLWRELTYR